MNEIENKVESKVGPDMHLGCGGKPVLVGKTKKICADCGTVVEVDSKTFICPECDGPLG